MATILVKEYLNSKQDFTKLLDYHDYMNEDAVNIAKNLRLLMDYYKDTQDRAAKRCDVSQKTISNLLNPKDKGAPNLDKVREVAKGYKLKT